jgi:hypothetical protein
MCTGTPCYGRGADFSSMIPLARAWRAWLTFLCGTSALAGQAPKLSGFPFTDESLRYAVTWPSGLSLGEAHMNATRRMAANGREHWDFQLALDAAVPGFAVSDSYRADSSLDLCAVIFEKAFAHGARKSHEFAYFSSQEGVARRYTDGGGKSEVAVSACARDALTFLYFTRRELGQGRVPPREDVLCGASYRVQLEYTGAQTVSVHGVTEEADRLLITAKGPASQTTFEMFFARDAARTPLVVRVPLSMGSFSLQLAR